MGVAHFIPEAPKLESVHEPPPKKKINPPKNNLSVVLARQGTTRAPKPLKALSGSTPSRL